MSLEYYVYTGSTEPVSRFRLRDVLLVSGWTLHVCPAGTIRPHADDGPMKHDLVIGWRKDHPKAQAASSCLQQGEEPTLDRLYAAGDVASCEVATQALGETERLELSSHMTEKDKAAVSTAVRMYGIATRAGRSDASVTFQVLVWNALSDLTQGWKHDPADDAMYPPGTTVAPSKLPVQAMVNTTAGGLSLLVKWWPAILILAFLVWLATM